MIPEDFSIYDLVQNMRTQRPSIVQTKVKPYFVLPLSKKPNQNKINLKKTGKWPHDSTVGSIGASQVHGPQFNPELGLLSGHNFVFSQGPWGLSLCSQDN